MTAFGCQYSEKNEILIIHKDFGKYDTESDSIGVDLIYSRFDNWHDLIDYTQTIACSDSTPKITLNLENEIRTIYLQNPCWENYACILIYEHNTIKIHNDTISKNDEQFYSLDSIESVLKRDIENNGKDPRLCDDPDKLLVTISYDNYTFKNLPKTLYILTNAYERLTNKRDIHIWLEERIDIPPPLPLPPLIDKK